MTTLYKNVTVKSLLISGEVEVRPLAVDEIHHVVLLARKSGWYGNNKIINYLVENGALNEGKNIDPIVIDTFIRSSIARVVWIATLEGLAKYVNLLISMTNKESNDENRLKKIKITPYKFSDVGTPGLYWSIQKDMGHIDVDLFVEKLVNFMIPKVNNGKKILRGKAKEKYLQERWGNVCNWLLEKNFIDDGFTETLPSNIFPSPSERFYAILKVSETIDWEQYFNIVYWYNTCIEKLNFKSNKLGGLDVAKPVLITGIPVFVNILNHSKKIPLNVLIGLLNDLMLKKTIKSSKHYKMLISKFYKESIIELASKGDELKNKDKVDIAFDVLNAYADKIKNNKRLINNLCYVYWNEFSESISESIEKNYHSFLEENALTNIPDCYILVEGICEDIFFKRVLRLLNNTKVNIRILDCKSKHGVYSKYRDVINNEPYIGCILTVLDTDALKEHVMIKKLKCGSIYTAHFIYEKGTFEDLFPLEIHIKTVNKLYQCGKKVTKSHFTPGLLLEKQLKKIVWENKKSHFDKASYASAISQEIKSYDKVPHIAKLIVEKASELSNTKLKNKPKTYSVYSIDALANSIKM